MSTTQDRLLKMFFSEEGGKWRKRISEAFDVFYPGTLCISGEEEAKTYFTALVDGNLYEKKEVLRMFWNLGIKNFGKVGLSHVPKMVEKLEKLIDDKKKSIERVENAIILLNERYNPNKNNGDKDIDIEVKKRAYKCMLRALDLATNSSFLQNAIRGIERFADPRLDKGDAFQTLERFKDFLSKTTSITVLSAIAYALGIVIYTEVPDSWLKHFEEIGGIKIMLDVAKKHVRTNNEFFGPVYCVATFNSYMDKYKDELAALREIAQNYTRENDAAPEFIHVFDRKSEEENSTECTGLHGEKRKCQPFYVCLTCDPDKYDRGYCKYCFEKYHQGHAYTEKYGYFSCDQESPEPQEIPAKKACVSKDQ